ncbi:MAG: hypothetical protein R6U78_08850 [Bacteroidales bacterium]
MQKENNRKLLQDEALRHHPFRVPDGYFESFAGRLQQRIREEEEKQVPVRRLWHSARFRTAVAAAVILLALVSFPLLRMSTVNEQLSGYPEEILLENMNMIEEDIFLMELMDNVTTAANDEEMYLDQAMEHLAMNEVELDLISE